MPESGKSLLVIVTGLSGAGRSVAINALEDNGFYCMDNLPVAMVDAVVEFISHSPHQYYAIGMDIRDAAFVKDFLNMNIRVRQSLQVDVVFLTASEETLARRYSETRRRHPLLDTGGELVTAVRLRTRNAAVGQRNRRCSL